MEFNTIYHAILAGEGTLILATGTVSLLSVAFGISHLIARIERICEGKRLGRRYL